MCCQAGVILLSWLFLRATYGPRHCLGAAVCVAGVALLVIFDSWQQRSPEMQHPLAGDALVLLGASCYASCNVLQELMLGKVSQCPILFASTDVMYVMVLGMCLLFRIAACPTSSLEPYVAGSNPNHSNGPVVMCLLFNTAAQTPHWLFKHRVP